MCEDIGMRVRSEHFAVSVVYDGANINEVLFEITTLKQTSVNANVVIILNEPIGEERILNKAVDVERENDELDKK